MGYDYYSFQDLIDKRASIGRSYHQFFEDIKWSAGIYHLEAGSKDQQSPHDFDELYYVIEGKSKFMADSELAKVIPGSILWVKAKVDHRFYDIEQDLQVLVIFSKANSDNAPLVYFPKILDYGTLLNADHVNLSIVDSFQKSGFRILLGSQEIGLSIQGEEQQFLPGVLYFSDEAKEKEIRSIERLKILAITNR